MDLGDPKGSELATLDTAPDRGEHGEEAEETAPLDPTPSPVEPGERTERDAAMKASVST